MDTPDSLSLCWGCSDRRLHHHRHTSRDSSTYAVDVPGGALNSQSLEEVITLLRLIPKITTVHLEVHTDCLGAQAMGVAEEDYLAVVLTHAKTIKRVFPHITVTAYCLTKMSNHVPEWHPQQIDIENDLSQVA